MSLDGQGPDPTLAARGILPVGPRQPEMEPLHSFQTDSVETHAYAFENLCKPEPIRVYAARVSMAHHHASLARALHSGPPACPRPYSLYFSTNPQGAIAVLSL